MQIGALLMTDTHNRFLGNHALSPETLMMSYGYDPFLSERSLKPPIFHTSTFYPSARSSRRSSTPRLSIRALAQAAGLPHLDFLSERSLKPPVFHTSTFVFRSARTGRSSSNWRTACG